MTDQIQHGYALHYGQAPTPLVLVVADDRWPGMWRMVWPDGRVSDMGNLVRIKDAAAEICDRGPPRRDRRRFCWKVDRRETPACGSLDAISEEGLLPSPVQLTERGGLQVTSCGAPDAVTGQDVAHAE